MQTKLKKIGNNAYRLGVQLVAVGGLTGLFAGLAVTLFNALLELCEEFSRGYYGFFRDNPAFIPLLFLALLMGSVVMGGFLRFLPVLRGGGFARTEGATRGLMRFKWYQALCGAFTAGLLAVFLGLSAGGEGPSVLIGGSCGYGVSDVLKRNPVVRRYQITGGACAGLAVALNAPLTGIIFAYEEAHKRFTPEVFVCSFVSVVFAVVVRALLRPLFHLPTGAYLAAFTFPQEIPLLFCLYALGAALVCALVATGFYYLLILLRRLFKKWNFWKGWGKYSVAFLLAGAAGLCTPFVMGGGTELISALSSGNEGEIFLYGAPFAVALLVIFLLKFITTIVNVGLDLPVCASVPMLAMGAAVGKLLSLGFVKMGMDPSLSDALVVLCMVTFFSTVVKAPITGIIMTVELTWNFLWMLPAVLCMAVGYFVGAVFHTEPLYEELLEELLEEENKTEKLTVFVRVTQAAGRAVRDVLWPFSALVTSVRRGEEVIPPKGDTELCEGDILTVEGTPTDREEYLAVLAAAVGEVAMEEGKISEETGA